MFCKKSSHECAVLFCRRRNKEDNTLVYRNGGNSVVIQDRASAHAHTNHVALDHVDHNANTHPVKQYTVLNTSMASSTERSTRKAQGKKNKHLVVANANTLPYAHKAHSDIVVHPRVRAVSEGHTLSRADSPRNMESASAVYKVHQVQQGNSGKTMLMLEPTGANVTTLSRTEAQKREVHNWVRSNPSSTLASQRAASHEILMAGMDDRRDHGHEQRRHFSDGTDGPLTIEGRITTDQFAYPREIALSSDAVDHSGRKVPVQPSGRNIESVMNCIPDPDTSGGEKTYVRWSPSMKRRGDQDLFIPSPEPEMTSQSSYVIASGTLTLPHRTGGRTLSHINSKPVGTLPVRFLSSKEYQLETNRIELFKIWSITSGLISFAACLIKKFDWSSGYATIISKITAIEQRSATILTL